MWLDRREGGNEITTEGREKGKEEKNEWNPVRNVCSTNLGR